MKAKELFEKLGYEYQESYFEQKLDSIIYKNNDKRATQIEFSIDRKVFKVFFEKYSKTTYSILPSCVDMPLLVAINKQIEELGWTRK